MALRDFYTILELSPSASREEIKKAYRRLAQLYHPDKKSGDPYAAVQFAAIKEAYETLMHPGKKDAYLQERWYEKSRGRNTNGTGIVTPVVILKQLLELEKYMRKIDSHRTNHEATINHLDQILSGQNIDLLNTFNDISTNREIALSALRTFETFNIVQISAFRTRIGGLRCDDPNISIMLEKMLANKKQALYWDDKKPLLIMTAVIVICLIIYLTAKS